MKMKKLVALALASAMVLTSAITVSASTTEFAGVDVSAFWDAHTNGIPVVDGGVSVTYTAKTYETASANWNTPSIVVYTSEDGKVERKDKDGKVVEGKGYVEYGVVRSDCWGWATAGPDFVVADETKVYPADWAAWLTANKAGVAATVTASITDGKITVTNTNNGVVSVGTGTVDTDKPTYIAFTGDACTVSDIKVTADNPLVDAKIVSASDSVFHTGTLDLKAEITHKYDPYLDCDPYKVVWSTSDASIAKVTAKGENGESAVVKPVELDPEVSEKEEVTITLSVVDPENEENVLFTAEKKITVTATWKALESVTIAADKTELTVGDSAQITATRNPADTTNSSATVYTSSDKSVIRVDSATGEVYAAGAGEATVTATVTNAKDGEIKSEPLKFTVAAPAEDPGEEEPGDDATGEDDTPAAPEGSETMTCPGWWKVFSQSWDLTEQDYEITFTTKNEGTNNWHNAIFALFYSDDGVMPSVDEEERAAVNYKEYWVGRLDAFGWGPEGTEGTFTAAAEDTDWDAFLAATQAGAPATITASVADGVATIVSSCAGVEYTTTVPVDASKPVYLCLGGELCTLSDLVVNGEATLFGGSADGAQEDGDVTPGEVDDTKGNTAPGTSDATPIIPVALALLGCAAVVVAKKKLV